MHAKRTKIRGLGVQIVNKGVQTVNKGVQELKKKNQTGP